MRTMWQRARRQSLPAFASYGPTVCLCACLYVWEICNGTVGNKKQNRQLFLDGPPPSKKKTVMKQNKKDTTKRSWKAKFALKRERMFSAFLFFAD